MALGKNKAWETASALQLADGGGDIKVWNLAARTLRWAAVTLMLVVIGDQVRTLTDTITVRLDTAAVQRQPACSTNDAVVGGRACAGLAKGRAGRAGRSIREASIWADGSSGRCCLCSNALRPIIRVLSESALARDAVS